MISEVELIKRLAHYRWTHNLDARSGKEVRIGIMIGIKTAISMAQDLKKETEERLKGNTYMVNGVMSWARKCFNGGKSHG